MNDSPEECSAARSPARNRAICPSCRRPGRGVDEITLRALLKPAALERRGGTEHRFCTTPECPIVYFGSEETFGREDLSVPVLQKQAEGPCPVCYCFGITRDDIRNEIAATGRTTAPERIRRLVEADRCACELRNPQGSCCLGNVSKLIDEIHNGPGVVTGFSSHDPCE